MDKNKLSIKLYLFKLWNSNNTPHEIALGVAVGIFIGITPFYGFHLIMALICAVTLKHLNKVAIFLGINISVPPTIPFITWAGYSIGRKILKSDQPVLSWDDFRHFSIDTFLNFFYELTVGSFVLGIILSVIFYFITLFVFKRKVVIKNNF